MGQIITAVQLFGTVYKYATVHISRMLARANLSYFPH